MMTQAPAFVRLSNPLARRMFRLGLPTGPNVLLTVRGRVSGQPRTVPVAVVKIGEGRFIIAAYGDVQWVRNLRAAGEAVLETRGRSEHVAAAELDRNDAIAFYRDELPGFIAAFPLIGRGFARVLFGLVAPELLNDPERAAATHPVFELRRSAAK